MSFLEFWKRQSLAERILFVSLIIISISSFTAAVLAPSFEERIDRRLEERCCKCECDE